MVRSRGYVASCGVLREYVHIYWHGLLDDDIQPPNIRYLLQQFATSPIFNIFTMYDYPSGCIRLWNELETGSLSIRDVELTSKFLSFMFFSVLTYMLRC